MNSKDFCTYEQSKALKESGFNNGTIAFYIQLFGSDEIKLARTEDFDVLNVTVKHLAPLKQQALRFFREKFGLFGCVHFVTASDGVGYTIKEPFTTNNSFDTYEEAEHALIDKLIEIANERQQP